MASCPSFNDGNKSESAQSNTNEVYEKVAKFEESELRNFLEQVTQSNKASNSTLSPDVQYLLKKEEEYIKEESGSGEDSIDKGTLKRKKRNLGRYIHSHSDSKGGSSAAARSSTGGSLGSLQDLTEDNKVLTIVVNNPNVSSKSISGSCGNLSRGSFETQPPRKHRRGRKNKGENSRASSSQKEGGSLQNISKSVGSCNESKQLHKSGSLSQVFSDNGLPNRNKGRRQKTPSESSGSSRLSRPPEDLNLNATDDECTSSENRRRIDAQSPHSGVDQSSFQPEGIGTGTGGSYVGMSIMPIQDEHNNEDSLSVCSSGSEGSDYDVESGKKSNAHILSVNASYPNYRTIARPNSSGKHVENGTEMQTFSVQENAHYEVDHPVNFDLNRGDNNLPLVKKSRSRISERQEIDATSLVSRQDKNCRDFDDLMKFKENVNNEDDEKKEGYLPGRTFSADIILPVTFTGISKTTTISFNERHISGTYTVSQIEKNDLDENGNPCNGFGSSSGPYRDSIGESASSESVSRASPLQLASIPRRSALNPHKEIYTNYDKIKARVDKKKANKEKDVKSSENTPGFRGDASLPELLQYLGAEDDTTKKNKKKTKNKKTDKSQGGDDAGSKQDRGWEDGNGDGGGSWSDFHKDSSGKIKITDRTKKMKGKSDRDRNSRSKLRESSSVEDLVSKSKQNNSVMLQKQATVDGGNLARASSNTYHGPRKDRDQDNDRDNVQNKRSSEFGQDFYRVGDPFQDVDGSGNVTGGDFEVVNRRRSKRNKSTGSWHTPQVSQGTRFGGSEGGMNYGGQEDSKPVSHSHRSESRHDYPSRPYINFSEGPRTSHDDSFITQWPQGGNDRYHVAAGAPHSEDSDSDRDSVHSMPVNGTTSRPDVRKPPPSSDSTPQTSYANIAKLAANTSKAQMKRIGTGPNGSDLNGKSSKEQSPIESEKSLLDDHFPSLSETVNGFSQSQVSSNCSKSSNNDSGIGSISESCNSVTNISNQSTTSISSERSKSEEPKSRTFSNESVDRNDLESKLPNGSLLDSELAMLSDSPKVPMPNIESTPPNPDQSNNTKKGKLLKMSPPISHSTPHISHTTMPVSNTKRNETEKVQLAPSSLVKPTVPQQGSIPNKDKNTAMPKSVKNIPVQPHSIMNNNNNSHNCGKTTNTNIKTNPIENGNNNNESSKTPAVIFTGNKSKKLGPVPDIEFGFGFNLDDTELSKVKIDQKNKYNTRKSDVIVSVNANTDNKRPKDNNKTSAVSKTNANSVISVSNRNANSGSSPSVDNCNKKNKDFSKMFQPPKNDTVPYNYEDLVKHFCKSWDTTMRLLEEDPKNIQYWSSNEG